MFALSTASAFAEAPAEPAPAAPKAAENAENAGSPAEPKPPEQPPEKAPPVIKAGPTDGRVLPPKSNELLEAAFARMAPTWTLKDAKIEKKTVSANVCDAAGKCLAVKLSDPKADCGGETVGAWEPTSERLIWRGLPYAFIGR